MRVYLAATLSDLAAAWDRGELADSAPAHAVTPALREWYVDDDAEELEYAAMSEAARESLHLIGEDADARPCRVVVAVDVDDGQVRSAPEGGPPAATPAGRRSRVRIDGTVPLARAAAVHVDDEAAADTVRAGVEALPAAAAGDPDASFTVDEVAGYELLWYATHEVPDLLGERLRH